MKRTRFAFAVISLVVALVVLLSVAPASANILNSVKPAKVDTWLTPGGSMTVTKEVTTPPIPPKIDIVLLQDETGSMWDDIATLQALAPAIWDAIAASGVDFTMGVVGFRDFAQNWWGIPGDHVYRRLQDLTTVKATFVAGVNNLTAPLGAGFDEPEAQLEALHYLATPGHAGIDGNGDLDLLDVEDTPAGLQPTWRANTQRVVLLATDATFHVTGDAGGWPGDAGTASVTVTAGILNAAGIIVIGLVPGGAGTIGDVDSIASLTGGTVQDTGATGGQVKDAILAALQALTTDVWHVVTSDPGLTVTLSPTVIYGVTGSTTVTFTETISVAADPALSGQTLTATVTFLANKYPQEGAVIGVEEIEIDVWVVPPVPASSYLGTGLMIGGFAALIALLVLWRARRYQHQPR